MSDAVVTVILTQVATVLEQQIRQELRLICGLNKEVRKLRSEFQTIQAVLLDAEKRQLNDHSVKLWLQKLNDVSYDAEDVLSECITLLKTPPPPSSWMQKVRSCITADKGLINRVVVRRKMAIKIKKINETLAAIATEKDRYNFNIATPNDLHRQPRTVSFIDLSQVRGRDDDTATIIRKVLSNPTVGGLNIVSIVGLGGIGKTTLAQAVYNSSQVISNFDKRLWVCVSDPFDEVRIAKAILEDAEKTAPSLFELETIMERIRDCIKGKKFMLVLDDVWTEDYRKWEQVLNSLQTGEPGSTILVTTRNERAASVMGSRHAHHLGKLSSTDSWEMFKEIAFCARSPAECEQLESVAREISDNCNGLPLAIKTIASLMRLKNGFKEWKDVLESEFWRLEEAEKLFPPLLLSYYDLRPFVKRCFSFCAIFPKDHVIEADNLIKLWMAQGYLADMDEVIGQEYLRDLVNRSFFEKIMDKGKDGKRSLVRIKMHDMIHDLAQYLMKNECAVNEANCEHISNVRHLTLIRSQDISLPKVPNNVERLSTFWIQSFHDSPPIIAEHDRVEAEFFDHLPRLRALDLSHNRIGEVAKEIGGLVQLKYLNLSHNPLRELPENLCDLYNLQTLKLSGCDHLKKLPQEIGKLVNLRHLEIDGTDSLEMLPKGINKLGSLQTLSKFIVARRKDSGACELEDLGKLNNLRGHLKIEGLGFVADGDKAKLAELHKKIHLTNLHLDFSPAMSASTCAKRQEDVIEALVLHANVESVQISSYGGSKLPRWILTLVSMHTLLLQDCNNCSDLPPDLGTLQSLATLHLEGMSSLKVVKMESGVFPKLKKLKISKMNGWEEWNTTNDDQRLMPLLRCLKILDCPKLKSLPKDLLQRKTIKKRRICRCPALALLQ